MLLQANPGVDWWDRRSRTLVEYQWISAPMIGPRRRVELDVRCLWSNSAQALLTDVSPGNLSTPVFLVQPYCASKDGFPYGRPSTQAEDQRQVPLTGLGFDDTRTTTRDLFGRSTRLASGAPDWAWLRWTLGTPGALDCNRTYPNVPGRSRTYPNIPERTRLSPNVTKQLCMIPNDTWQHLNDTKLLKYRALTKGNFHWPWGEKTVCVTSGAPNHTSARFSPGHRNLTVSPDKFTDRVTHQCPWPSEYRHARGFEGRAPKLRCR